MHVASKEERSLKMSRSGSAKIINDTLCETTTDGIHHHITKTRPCNILQCLMAVKNNFQMKICDGFLIFAQNIDCGYTLEM